MKEDVKLVQATPEDVPGLDVVRRQAIETGFTGVYERSQFADLVARPDPDLANWIEDDRYLVLVMKSELTLCAYGVLDQQEGQLKGLYTADSYQREGHAGRILSKLEETAREAGQETITIEAPKNSITFFEAHHFRKVGETTQWKFTLTLTVMKKSL